jgi:hypothetical protein
MLDITRMLTEKKFRKDVIDYIQDPVVKGFWVNEFASWNDKFAAEAVAPVLNKVGAFTANPMIRNIIGQPKSTFNIRQIMDEGKILIVNLSRGLMGEDNAGILGAMMVTKIQLSAMGRADVPESQRRPFYLYVDEFQNFATDSFAVILSEARKYALNLTVANQYISQMSQPVRDAVFGNVGTIVSFRVSPDDAPFLQKYFEPQFESADLIQQHNRYFVVTMTIDGEKAPAFSAKTLNLPQTPENMSSQIIELSRQRYAQERAFVEARIRENLLHHAEGGLPSSKPTPKLDRPKAQAQLNRLETNPNTGNQSNPHQTTKVASTLLKAFSAGGDKAESATLQIQQSTDPSKPKRRRTRRGGRGRSSNKDSHQARTNQNQPKKPHPSKSPAQDEQVIRLR